VGVVAKSQGAHPQSSPALRLLLWFYQPGAVNGSWLCLTAPIPSCQLLTVSWRGAGRRDLVGACGSGVIIGLARDPDILAECIHPGDAALFVLIKEMTADKVIEQIKHYGGVVLKTSLADDKEQALRGALARAAASDAAPPATAASS
jgi:hypothetical protein